MSFGSGWVGRNALAYPVIVTIGALAVCLAWAPFASLDQLAVLASVAIGIGGYTGFQLVRAHSWLLTGLPNNRNARELVELKRVRQQHRLVSRSWLEISTTNIEPVDASRAKPPTAKPMLPDPSAVTHTYWLPVYFDPAVISMTKVPAAGALRPEAVAQRNHEGRRERREMDSAAGALRPEAVAQRNHEGLGEIATAQMMGDSLRTTALQIYPSGRARSTEPPGRLIDNPSRPAADAPALAAESTRLRRRLLLDGQSAVAAPFAALLWVYIDGGGFTAFIGATCVAAATTVWLSAIRGSDPS